MFDDKGEGIWTIEYFWRDAAEALLQFRKSHTNLNITAMFHEQNDHRRKITLVTEIPEKLR